MEVSLHYREVSKEVAGKNKGEYPGNSSKDVIEEELLVVHRPNTSHERGKGSDNGSKPSGNDGKRTPVVIKLLGLNKIGSFKKATVFLEDLGPQVLSDMVIDCIPNDTRDGEADEKYPNIKALGQGCKCTKRKEK